MSVVEIRDALEDDASEIAAIQTRTWQVAYAHVFPATALKRLAGGHARRVDFWRAKINEPAERSGTLVVVATVGVAGFADIGPTRDGDLDDERVGELNAIYVSPEWWRQGVGRHLMEALLARLREYAFSEAMLWVLEDNPRTRRFYESAGWRTDDAIKEDHVLDTPIRELRYWIVL